MPDQATHLSAPARYALLMCGWAALGLAALGVVLPVLPTTPFVLLAAACFLRSSQRLHAWIVSHPRFGPHIDDYLAGRGLRRRTKRIALLTLWASVLVSVYFSVALPALALAVLAVAAGVSVYIVRLPTSGDATPKVRQGPGGSDGT